MCQQTASTSTLKKIKCLYRFLGKHAQKQPLHLLTGVVLVPEVLLGKTLVETSLSKVDSFLLCQCHPWFYLDVEGHWIFLILWQCVSPVIQGRVPSALVLPGKHLLRPLVYAVFPEGRQATTGVIMILRRHSSRGQKPVQL